MASEPECATLHKRTFAQQLPCPPKSQHFELQKRIAMIKSLAIPFRNINSQEEVDSARKYNAQFDGVGLSQLDGFAKLLATSKDKLEETFHNIEIRQDGPLGLVTFNFDFVVNDKVHHSGVEHWQVCKIDGQWKILSVAWTIYP